jgi:aminoglycoside phosphotransferase family enzyme
VNALASLRLWLEEQHGGRAEIIQGAISDVITIGDRAYKMKRPLHSKYVRYETCELRHRFCLDEVRLNRKFWPELYRGVVPVTATDEGVEFDGRGPVVDWVVEMSRFAQADLLINRPVGVSDGYVFQFGAELATIHANADVVPRGPDPVRHTFEWMSECLDVVREKDRDLALSDIIGKTLAAVVDVVRRSAPALILRAKQGWTREIHGDLHPGNLVFSGGAIHAFDCLEYSDALRQLDVLVDVGALSIGLERLLGFGSETAFVAGWRSRLDAAFDLRIFHLYRAGRRLVDAKVASLVGATSQDVRAHLTRALEELQETLDEQ